MRIRTIALAALVLLLSVAAPCAFAQAQAAAPAQAATDQELAKKLANPIASMVSFPIQLNYDTGFGPTGSGSRLLTNVQPVVPIALSKSWNLVSRTILPIVSQSEMYPGGGRQFGIGDITQSAFFSPVAPTKGGLIWGAGPVLLLPTATDDLLGGDKWGAGPTFVVLKQTGPQTIGMLANHIWSVAGDDDRPDVSSTFIQPFLSYTTKKATTYMLNSEATYDWKSDEWSVPINLQAGQMTRFGAQRVSVGAAIRYWAHSPPGGADGFGLRLFVTYLFPK